jgi:hypothetical protein
MNHLGRLVGWADAYPEWSFSVGGWEPIHFNGIAEGCVFKEALVLVEIEGYPLPLGAGPAYAEVRRRVLAGKSFEIRGENATESRTVLPKIFPRRRALTSPECYLRSTWGK